MRTRLVRVRRKHARSMRLAMLFLAFSIAVYLLSWALRGPASAPATEPVSTPSASLSPAPRVTEDIRLEPLSCYLVVLLSAESPEAARVEAARYVRRGAAGYVLPRDNQYLVIGAAYEAEAEAQKIAQRLGEQEKLTARVLPMASRPVALRVTATQAQLSALVQAEKTFRAIGTQLGEIAYALDAGTLTQDGALDSLSHAKVEAELAYRTLDRAAGSEQNPVVQGMLELVLQLKTQLQDRIAGSDATTLSFSAKIKYNKIGMRLQHIAYLDSLGA